jgi:hypothetical protein
LAIAQELALDMEQFNRDRASEGANAAIAQDLALAQELQLTSTPTFLMGELLLPGAIPADLFAEALIRLKAFDDAQPFRVSKAYASVSSIKSERRFSGIGQSGFSPPMITPRRPHSPG